MSDSDDFVNKMNKWVDDIEEKLTAVIKESIQDFEEEASTPVSLGGRMPVDTGFLRQSGVGDVNRIPSGESEKEKNTTYNYKPNLSALVNFKLGDTFYYGWTAAYANVQNIRYGFRDSALQNWSNIVDKNVRRLKE